MKGVQCYEIFGGIALKIHTLFFFFHDYNAVLLPYLIIYSVSENHSSMVKSHSLFYFKAYMAISNFLLL